MQLMKLLQMNKINFNELNFNLIKILIDLIHFDINQTKV